MRPVTTVDNMDLDGGKACLDFVNSGLGTAKGEIVERLHSYQDVLTLARRIRLLDKKILDRLSKEAGKHPKEARAAFEKALQARSSLLEILGGIADQKIDKLGDSALDMFNKVISATSGKQVFVMDKGALRLTLRTSETDLEQPLDAFVLSAIDLLQHKPHEYIKRCGRCQWLFLDQTKSHRRKWCSMKDCGSIMKARRHYQRKTGAPMASQAEQEI